MEERLKLMSYELASSSWSQNEIDAMQTVIDSGFFTMGPNVAAFEQEFADYFGMKHGVMVNSGSSANLVSIAALFYKKDRPLQRGDEVIVPVLSWSTTYHPLQQYGLKLKFVDISLDTLNMPAEQVRAAITPKTRMILAVSILGNPAEVDRMREIADDHSLYFMEDNCESADAELPNGRKTGTYGDLNTYSFFFSHHLATMEGGMVLTNDTELFHLLKSMRAHGWTRDLPNDSPLFERTGSDHFEAYRFILPGYNVRPIELSGAIGREQLKRLPQMTAQRRDNLEIFQKLFNDDDRFIIQQEYGKSSAFSFTIILNPKARIDRQMVFDRMRDEKIGFRIITGGCFLRHDVVKYYDYDIHEEIVNGYIAHDQGFFVGNHPMPIEPQLNHLWDVLNKAC
jgi:CDP-6-deoxy-D-xylo-4-hexulose-3-dehydrase